MRESQLITLEADLEDVKRLVEAGRTLSQANMQLIQNIKNQASQLSYHPTAEKIMQLCDQLMEAGGMGDMSMNESNVGESTTTEDKELEELVERDFTAEQRAALAKRGYALPDGSYPIETVGDLENAIQAIGRASDPARVKRHIIKRARALNALDKLPGDWNVRESTTVGFTSDSDGSGASVSGEAEHLTESYVQLIEAVDKTGREWEVMLIEKGLSKNGYYYPDSTLREAAPLFEGAYSFADHTNEAEQKVRPERSVKDKVGRFSGVSYGSATVNGRLVEGLRARYKVIAPWLRDMLVESVSMEEPDFVGFSIDALGKTSERDQGGKKVRWVEAIRKVFSVDVVTDPSAGGRLMRLVASNSNNERNEAMGEPTTENVANGNSDSGTTSAAPPAAPVVTADQISAMIKEALGGALGGENSPLSAIQAELTALREANRVAANVERASAAVSAASGLSDISARRLQESFKATASNRDLTDEEIETAIKETVDYEAALRAKYSRLPVATGREAAALTVTKDQADKYISALIGMFEGADQDGVPQFRSIKEAYCRWVGRDYFDVDPFEIQRAFSCKYDSAVDHARIQESLTRASWGEIYADVFYLQLMKGYRASPMYDRWRVFVSDIENVPDFQTRHFVRIGGYGDLSTVAEGQTYPFLTTPTDEEVTYSVSKRGGLDDVTFESIVNDRVGAVRRIPTAMARAAARTLFKFVMNLTTTDNPVMDYDSTTLYHANHSNTGTTALSLTGLQTVTAAMRGQTAYSETLEILGERNKPKTIIVPTALEFVAQRLVSPSDAYAAAIANPSTEQSLDPQAFKGAGLDYLVYDQFTDTNDWYAVADPNEVSTVVVGFLNGRQDPEMFVQDQPNVGSNFTADKVTYKVRHIYGGDVLDHRSFYRMVV